MKIILLSICVIAVLVLVGLKFRSVFSTRVTSVTGEKAASFYDLKTETLAGDPFDLGQYMGKVSLVVNTASKCGLTPQYKGLETLYRDLSDQGFMVLGFPSNDFLSQEPGSPAEIELFCSDNYDITFPLFAKTKVKGSNRSEIYQLLSAELEEPSWNFTKYLVGKNGLVVCRFGPGVKPDATQLREAIEKELAREQ